MAELTLGDIAQSLGYSACSLARRLHHFFDLLLKLDGQEKDSMKNFVTFGISAMLLAGGALAADKLKVEDLPGPVQQTVKEQTHNATLAGLAREKEDGKTVYEVETKVNGKSRDLMVGSDGKILSVEEETALESVPAAASRPF